MQINILNAHIQHDREIGYAGKVIFRVPQHKQEYEITLQSKNLKDWGYSLYFANISGPEEEINAVDLKIEEDDDFYHQFITAVTEKLNS
jgi:hypothetical protein